MGEPSERYPRYIGVEIECGRLGGSKVRGFHNMERVADQFGLRIGSDGSISQFAQTTEISTVPARGNRFEEQITALCEALAKDELKANSSCGLHVHIDVRDYMAEHLLALVRLYSLVEPSLYKIVAPSRRTNTYCKLYGSTFQDYGVLDNSRNTDIRMRLLDEVLYGSSTNANQYRQNRSKAECRYHGLNLNAISVHGTIEFRLHHGTVNLTKILMWSAVCSALVEYAFRIPEDEIIKMAQSRRIHILEKVAHDPMVVSWIRARKLFFANMERKKRGLVPAVARVSPERAKVPVSEPGEVEMSEG